MSLAALKIFVDEAEETDYIMPLWLPYAGVAPVLALSFTVIALAALDVPPDAAAPLVALLLLASIAGAAVLLYAHYKWIDRRNKHFRRTTGFYKAVAGFLEAHGLRAEAGELRQLVEHMEYRCGGEKEAFLWIVLSLVTGFLVFYVYHFLNRDFVAHDRCEKAILDYLDKLFKDKGLPGLSLDDLGIGRYPRRSTALYLLLTLVTLGIFHLYWIYTLTIDPNNHFKQHRVVEKKILENLEKLAASKEALRSRGRE